MKIFISTISVFVLCFVTTKCREFRDYDSPYEGYDDVSEKPFYDLKDAPYLFEKFIKDFNKSYMNEEEKMKHYEIFKQNVEEINKLNKGNEGETATFEINMFTDMMRDDDGEGWGDEQSELTSGTKGAEGEGGQGTPQTR